MHTHIRPGDIVAFVLEILALVFWGLIAWSLPETPLWRWVFALAAVAVFIVLWALFFSPKARRRIPMPWLTVAKVPMLLLPGLIFLRGRPVIMTVWTVLVLAFLTLCFAQWEK